MFLRANAWKMTIGVIMYNISVGSCVIYQQCHATPATSFHLFQAITSYTVTSTNGYVYTVSFHQKLYTFFALHADLKCQNLRTCHVFMLYTVCIIQF